MVGELQCTSGLHDRGSSPSSSGDARLSFEELIEKYDQLRGICGKAVALTKADRERDLVSLTSKGLWCCYPNGVPMFDRYVQSALWILCKLSQLCPKKSTASNGRYAGFADVWFQVYNQVEHIIAESGSDWLFLQGARFRSNAMGHRTTQLRSGYYRDQKIILTESKGTCGKRPESFTRRLRIARPRGRSLQRGSGDRDC